MLSASAEVIASDLRQYGESTTADWLLTCSDEELVRVCSVGQWLLYNGPGRPSGASMLFAKALSLAAVYVREGSPRELVRSRRRRLEPRQDLRGDGRRPDLFLAGGVPYAYGGGRRCPRLLAGRGGALSRRRRPARRPTAPFWVLPRRRPCGRTQDDQGP